MIHKHHIIPKHAGGTDHPSNLCQLTTTEHADAHNLLYCIHKNPLDKIAEQALLGQIDYTTASRMAWEVGYMKGLKSPKRTYGHLKTGKSLRTPESYAKYNKGASPKLVNDDLEDIQHLHSLGVTYKRIAELYKVHYKTITRLRQTESKNVY